MEKEITVSFQGSSKESLSLSIATFWVSVFYHPELLTQKEEPRKTTKDSKTGVFEPEQLSLF